MNFNKSYKIVRYQQPKNVSLKDIRAFDVIYLENVGDYDNNLDATLLDFKYEKGKERNLLTLYLVMPNGEIKEYSSIHYGNEEPEFVVVGFAKPVEKIKTNNDELTK